MVEKKKKKKVCSRVLILGGGRTTPKGHWGGSVTSNKSKGWFLDKMGLTGHHSFFLFLFSIFFKKVFIINF
jgi:hypothetical protein